MNMLREVQEKKNALQKILAGRDSRQADWRAIRIKKSRKHHVFGANTQPTPINWHYLKDLLLSGLYRRLWNFTKSCTSINSVLVGYTTDREFTRVLQVSPCPEGYFEYITIIASPSKRAI